MRAQADGRQLAFQLDLVDLPEALYGRLFLAEGLDDPDSGEVFVERGQGVADQVAYQAVGPGRRRAVPGRGEQRRH